MPGFRTQSMTCVKRLPVIENGEDKTSIWQRIGNEYHISRSAMLDGIRHRLLHD